MSDKHAGLASAHCPTCNEVQLCAEAIKPKAKKKKAGGEYFEQKTMEEYSAKWLCTVCGTIFTGKTYK
jgi:rubrerythrin